MDVSLSKAGKMPALRGKSAHETKLFTLNRHNSFNRPWGRPAGRPRLYRARLKAEFLSFRMKVRGVEISPFLRNDGKANSQPFALCFNRAEC